MLVLSPTKADQSINDEWFLPGQGNLWIIMARAIRSFMDTAHHSWEHIGRHLERLLPPPDSDELLQEDHKFSQSQKLFWIINKVDEIMPIISDGIEQWDWFREKKRLASLYDYDLMDRVVYIEDEIVDGATKHSPPRVNRDEMRIRVNREEMRLSVKSIDEIKQRLLKSAERFKAVRERALSLRDGVSVHIENKLSTGLS